MKKWLLVLLFGAVVVTTGLCLPAKVQAVTLGPGYVKIDNFAGYRYPGATESEDAQPGWSPIYLPAFENNSSYYVWSNTTSIRASLRTNSTTLQRTLRFDTSGPVVVGDSYTVLTSTEDDPNGHSFTAARFDWTISLPASYVSSKYVRLELSPSWMYYGWESPAIWSVQPGPGVHSGHVEVVFPEVWDLSFVVSVVEPAPVPEPSSLVCLLFGTVSAVGFARRRRRSGATASTIG